jgi:hypothetical protein
MVGARVWSISDVTHGGRQEKVRVVVAALRCDVGRHERCEYRGHLLLVVADDALNVLGE